MEISAMLEIPCINTIMLRMCTRRPQEPSTWHWIKLAGVKRCEGCFYIVWRYSWCNQFALSNCANQRMSARITHAMAVSARMLHDRRSVESKEENSLSTSSTPASMVWVYSVEHRSWLAATCVKRAFLLPFMRLSKH